MRYLYENKALVKTTGKSVLLSILFLGLVQCSLFSRRSEEPPADDKKSNEQAMDSHTVGSPTMPPGHDGGNESAHEAPQAPHNAGHEWSYSGETGPENWGGIKGEFALCKNGKEQSPVNLRWAKPHKGGKITFNYKESALRIIDNGHTIQVNFDPGSTATIRGKTYNLVQMHFHTSSEHTIAGNSLPMELHFVHKNDQGRLAVIGVIMIEGASNPVIEKIWANIPSEKSVERSVASSSISPADLLPKSHTYYHYMGSLTTPPCSEGVNWNVFNSPIELSREQILAFRQLYPNNSRPVQPLNARKTTNF